MIFKIFVFLSVTIICASANEIYEFHNITTSEVNRYFQPTVPGHARHNVTKVLFRHSIMPVITGELCNKFRNIHSLFIDDAQIERLDSDALEHCRRLIAISFRHNKLVSVNKTLFTHNHRLHDIYLSYNQLTHIDGELFSDLNDLQVLWLDNNRISKIDFTTFPTLNKLLRLLLQSNEIYDLDESVVGEKFPKLEHISVADNPFHCDRADDIYYTLKGMDIRLFTVPEPIPRNYSLTMKQDDKIHCLPHSLWHISRASTKENSL